AGVLALLWRMVNGAAMDALHFLWILLASVLFWVFLKWERIYESRGRLPMVDLDLFRLQSYTARTILALTCFSGFTGIFFILTLFFQNGGGFTALAAGLGLPSFAIGPPLSSRLRGRPLLPPWPP